MIKISKPYKRKDLLALPQRNWQTKSVYDTLFIVPTGKKHDSGWALIAIVGICYVDKEEHAEIAAYCDDICWSFPLKHPYDRIREGRHSTIMRTDMVYPSGIVRMWASGEHYFEGRFLVGCSLSSTDVELLVYPRGEGRNKATGEVVPMPKLSTDSV